MKSKVYVITGVAGFIGSHIAEELLKRDNVFVVGIDNFYSGKRDNVDLLERKFGSNFAFENLDITNFEDLSKVFEKYDVEYVFHQAAVASVKKSIEDPCFTHVVNVKGTLNVLESSRANNVKKVLFASSAAVYGNDLTLPKDEKSLIKPISPYGYEKYIGEQYLELYSGLYGLNCVALRYFNVYGPRQDPSSEYSGVVSIFEDRFSKNKPVTVYGDGEQCRDFVYVKDVVKVNLLAMDNYSDSFGVFCVGTARKTTLNDLIKAFEGKYNVNMDVSYETAREGDIKESVCDNKKVVSQLEADFDSDLIKNLSCL